MSERMRDTLLSGLGQLRHEPTAKRIRALVGDVTVLDTTQAVLIWEPRRVVASYAVPVSEIRAELLVNTGSDAPANDDVGVSLHEVSERPVLDPSVPFSVHTADGRPLGLRVGNHQLADAAFRLDDANLPDYVVLDFGAFDEWYEEDEQTIAHPRDPFHRIDALASSRHVTLELDGTLIADSKRCTLLFETMLPTRFYLPREDVRVELTQSGRTSYCAYKGKASYWSARIGESQAVDLAWSYQQPLHEASAVRGMVAFFDERIDVVLDGQHRVRPVTPWS